MKFGLIPEFVGRLPIIATLDGLTREALIDIVTKPKNALVKQYKKLVELDGVDLEFEQEALEAIVDKAIEEILVQEDYVQLSKNNERYYV